MKIRELTVEEYEAVLADAGVVVPIEQRPIWQGYQATIEGRTPWGYVAFVDDAGEVCATASFTQYETHGYRYLRSVHGPVWFTPADEAKEEAAFEALISYVRKRDSRQVFMRLAVKHELKLACPTLSTRPYDRTMVIDITGGDEEILARMKPRGRRDVRKALRESPAVCADETERAFEDFSDYYDVMCETAERDGFTPSPMSDYVGMLNSLGQEHCRVFAGRIDGRVVTFSIVTVSDELAVRYYAGSRTGTMRLHVTDALVYFECCELGRRGCTQYDLMGLGSEICPDLMGLNEFKTKFAKDGVRMVAPDRDGPIKRAFYMALVKARALRGRLRGHQGT